MSTIVSLTLLLVLSIYGAQGLSCRCQMERCEASDSIKQRCKGGLVYDVCYCCKTCAKVEGETCGGMWGFDGKCDEGLFCKSSGTRYMMNRGVCASRQETTTTTIPSTKVTTIPTRWQKILRTTEQPTEIIDSYFDSGDGEDIDEEERPDEDIGSGEVTEQATSTTWTWLLPQTTEGITEEPILDLDEDENEDMQVFF